MTFASRIFLGTALLYLTGCVSTTEIARLDRDTYTVASSSTSTLVSDQELLLTSAKKATEYCAHQGKDMVRDDGLVSRQGFNKREFMFNFQCVEK